MLQYCPKRKNSEHIDQKKRLANHAVHARLWRWRPLRLRSRTLQPLTAPSPRARAAPPWPARTHTSRPIAAFVREAVRVPQNRNATHAPRRHPCGCRRSATWSPASNRSTSIAKETCVPSDSCLAQVGLRAESHSKKTIQNLIGRRNFLAGASSSQSASQITAAAIRPHACTPPRLLHAPRDAMPVPAPHTARQESARHRHRRAHGTGMAAPLLIQRSTLAHPGLRRSLLHPSAAARAATPAVVTRHLTPPSPRRTRCGHGSARRCCAQL